MAAGAGTAGASDRGVARVATVVGLACLWPCMGSSATMHFRHAMSSSASVIGTSWHAVVLATLYLLVAALCVLRRSDVARLLRSPHAGAAGLAAGVAGLAGHVVLVTTPLAPSAAAATALTLAGFALTVGFIVAHVVGWFSVLARLPLPRVLGVLVASSALAYALQLAFDVAVGPGMLYALVACPLASGVCLFLAARCFSCQAPAAGTPGPGASPVSAVAALRALPWGRIAPILALIYLEQALTGLLFQRYADWPRDNLTLTLVGGLVIWLVAGIFVRRAVTRADDVRPAYVGLFALLLVVYMAALLATVVLPVTEAPVAERLLVCAGSAFRTLLWAVLALAVAQGGSSPLAAALAYVVLVLGVPVSRLASLGFSAMDPSLVATLCSPSVIVPLAAAILFVVAGTFVLANARATRRLMGELAEPAGVAASQDAAGRRARACADLARAWGLTPRESEVLELVCGGYSARHAGERLGISESTVVSHVSHIYRKAGVSNRQQLVALVDERAGKA